MLLETGEDIEVVGEAGDGRTAVQMATRLRPDVVLMDVAMPLLNGLEAARQILAARPQTRILILSAHEDDACLERALAIGVAGYLIKQTSIGVLSQAIRAVAAGRSFLGPSIALRLSHREKVTAVSTSRKRCISTQLTSRESEVLQLIAEGNANKQTAAELGISFKTVEKHRQCLMGKLNIHDTAGLTRHAIASGFIESSVQSTTR